MNKTERILYASNVTHSSHIHQLLKNFKAKKYVMLPWVPNACAIAIARLFSHRLSQVLASRFIDRVTHPEFKKINLGIVQFYAPLKIFLFNKSLTQKETSLVNSVYKLRLATKAINKDLVIITRDIYSNTLRFSKALKLIEMREHHPDIYFRNSSIYPDFPIDTHRDEAYLQNYRSDFEFIKKNSSALITYSEMTKSTFVSMGYSEKNIFIFPLKILNHGKQKFEVKKKEQCVYVGRDSLTKGLDYAVALTEKRGLKLLVVGHYSAEVIDWLSNFRHVQFIGYLNRKSLKNLMLESKYLLAPSVESFGLVVIEGLESGCLIISSVFNGAAQTNRNNPNVFCSNSLEIEKMLDQLDLARNSKYDYEYYSFNSEFSTSFYNFVKTLGN
jgi:glycosyltransferase involved in cell wall biosynthesis